MPQTQILVFRSDDGTVPTLDWLEEVERRNRIAFAKCVQRIQQLESLGYEMRRPGADSLRDGIYELRARSGSVQYRLLYFFHGQNVAILSHGLTKEKNVPDKDIELAKKRRRLIQSNPDRYTADFQV